MEKDKEVTVETSDKFFFPHSLLLVRCYVTYCWFTILAWKQELIFISFSLKQVN